MNMQALMQQAQKMQKDIQKKQEEVSKMEFEGKSEWVTVKLNGKKEMVSIKITSSNLDVDDIEMLEDMIRIAFKDALEKIDKEYDNKLGMYGKQLNGLI